MIYARNISNIDKNLFSQKVANSKIFYLCLSDKFKIMICLSPEIITAIKEDAHLRLKIQAIINVSHNTMIKYLDENDGRLTQLDVINLITDEFQMPLSEIIQGGKLSKLLAK